MRWRFLDPRSRREVQQRAVVREAMDRWWDAFRVRRRALEEHLSGRSPEFDLPLWMHERLGAVHPDLRWEFSREPTGGHRLAITPEERYELRPLVATLLDLAPDLSGWRFVPYRPPVPASDARELVEARAGVTFPDDLRVRARAGRRNLVELTFASAALPDPDALWRIAFVTSEALLGEERLDHWLGRIAVDGTGDGRGWVPVERLRGTVEAVVAHITEQLPDRPRLADEDEPPRWYDVSGRPAEREDYPRRDDVLAGATRDPRLWRAAAAEDFASERFSRCGEGFAYVKLEGYEPALRHELEEDLDRALREAELGCVTGGAAGLRYGYVDLALSSLEEGVELTGQVLCERRVPRRTWVLFPDRDLRGEWVGAWGDTPPPPGAPPELSSEEQLGWG